MMLNRRAVVGKIWSLPLVLLLALATAGWAIAAPLDPAGDLDTSFSSDGKAPANFANVTSFSEGRAVGIQSTGKIVIGGNYSEGGLDHFGLIRLDSAGLQDMSFGATGTVKVPVGSYDFMYDLAVQSDDKTVAAGFAGIGGNEEFALVRLTADGDLDTAFDSDGIRTFGFGAGTEQDRAKSVAIQQDGKLVVVGEHYPGSNRNIAVARLNTNGSFDTSFSGDGKIVTDLSAGDVDRANAVAIYPVDSNPATINDGKIIVVGRAGSTSGGNSICALVRYNADGSLDSTFDIDGIATFSPDRGCEFQGVAIQADEKIVVTGRLFTTADNNLKTTFAIARVNANGSLDTSFNSSGWVQTISATSYRTDVGTSVQIQPDGKIIALGWSDRGNVNHDFIFVRLNTNGSYDTSFDSDGKALIDLSGGSGLDYGYSLALDSSGRAVGVGSRESNTEYYISAARLTTSGVLDTTFGPDAADADTLPDGYFYTQLIAGSVDSANGMAVQADGKIVTAGYTDNGSNGDFALARFDTSGNLDSSFSGNGLVNVGNGTQHDTAHAVAIQPADQKIVVAGDSYGTGTPSFTIMRFTTSGALDTSFDSDGIATTTFGTNSNTPYAVAIDANGKIVVGGTVSDSSGNWDFGLARFNADGSLDTSFDSDGKLRLDIGTGQNFDEIHAIVIDANGKILVGGYSNSSSSSQFVLARFNNDGTADTSFNSNGRVVTRLSDAANQYAGDQIRSIAIQPDGKIIAGGKALNAVGYNTFALARFNANGSLDTTFDGDGKILVSFATNQMAEIFGIALQSDEKVVGFGTAGADFGLARFNWDDGSLDTTYGTNGFVTTDFSGYDYGSGGVLLIGGKAVGVGTSGASDFAVARYLGDPAPTVPTAPDLVSASDTGSSNTDNNTKDTTPTFSGTCVTGETMVFKLGGADTSPRTRLLCRNGTYSITVPAALADGTHLFSMVAANGAGSSAAGASLTVVIDNAVVAPVITSPAASSTQLPNPTISGTGAEVGASVSVSNQANGSVLCTATANGSGAWSCVATLGVGSYTIAARQTDLAGNISATVTRSFDINVPTTTTTLTSNSNPSVYGQSVTLNATVTSSSGTPTGTVQFVVDSETPVLVTLSASGTATLTRTNLSVGTHSITANYQGTSSYLASSGGPLTQTVNKAGSTVSIASSANPSVVGQSTTFTALVTAVTPGVGLPTGTVTFKDAGTAIGTQTLNGTGQATLTSAALMVGAHAITVVYNGDGNFNTSAIASLTQSVNQADTMTAITADTPDPSVLGQPVTFYYSVSITSPGAGSLTGNVTISDGTNSCIGSIAAGSCTLTITTPAASNFTASYSGDSNFKSSSSPVALHTANKISTSIAITADTPAPSVVGQPVSIAYLVTVNAPGSGTPTGNVTISDGTTSCTATVSAGSCSIIFTSASSKNLTATYIGDSTFNGSTSETVVHVVNQAATVTSITADMPDPSVVGQPVAISYNVQVTSPGAGTPTGNVTVTDGANSCTGSVSTGSCTFTPSSPSTAVLVATYNGDSSFSGSVSTAEPHTIGMASTLTSITVHSPDPSVVGGPVTILYTVGVVAPGSGTPTGNVTISDGAQTCAGSVAAGSCVITFAILGSTSLTATYPGDSNFIGSTSSAATHVVNKPATTTAITSDLSSPSLAGQPVTIAYLVTVNAPGIGTPTGNVTVSDGTNSCTGTVADGQCSVTFTSAGSKNLTADYAGDSGVEKSNSNPTTSHLVTPADTTISVLSSLNPTVFGQTVNFTATVAVVTPGNGLPSGTITFKDGTATLGTATLDATGQVTFSTAGFPVGAHAITAEYAGSADFNASVSSPVAQAVDKAGSGIDLAVSTTQSVVGQSVIFTATVAVNAPGAGQASGNVTFKDGSTTLASGTLDATGQASFTTAGLAVGAHAITAEYAGDNSFTGNLSAQLDVSVEQADTSISLISSLNPAVIGETVTFTTTVAVVAPGNGLPSGTITFKDGSTTLASGTLDAAGQASFTITSLVVGAHAITAEYAGDASFNATTTAPLHQAVAQADSTISLSASLTASTFGQSATFIATVTTPPAAGMPTGGVIFKDGGIAFGTGILNGTGTAIFTTAGLAAGTHMITAEYAGDTNFNASISTSITVMVAKATTTTSVASSPNPSAYAQSVSLIATVGTSAGAGVPTGSVTFREGVAILQVVALDSTGVASFTTDNLDVAAHLITAEYSGDDNRTASTSPALTQVVLPSADVMVSNRASASQMNGGGTLVYTIVVTNSGPLEATNVVLSISLPPVSSLNTPPAGCTATNIALKCSLGTITKDAVISQTLSVSITPGLPDGTVLSSRATITSDTLDGNPANNHSQASTVLGRLHVYLPLFMQVEAQAAKAPDLVVTRMMATPSSVEIVIKNQGNVAATEAFWVDLYVAPTPVPSGPNQIWSDGRSKEGAVWGVQGVSLDPGAELHLTLNDAYFAAQYSRLKQFVVGTRIYVQVDSANFATSYGAIQEADEISGGVYNNISSTIVVANGAAASALVRAPAFNEQAMPGRAQARELIVNPAKTSR